MSLSRTRTMSTGVSTRRSASCGAFPLLFEISVPFDDIIVGAVDRKAPMNRPHIGFDGDSLSELPEKWSHAQYDALGYFVWLFCNLASDGTISRQQATALHYWRSSSPFQCDLILAKTRTVGTGRK